jgi:hypothetical protein
MAGPWEKYQNQASAGPWTKYAQQPQLPAGADGPLPGVPGIQKPDLQPVAATGSPWSQQKVGSVMDTVSNVGTHLKNLVAGPYHAFTDAPTDPTEQAISTGSANMPFSGNVALGAYRMLAKPSVDAVQQSMQFRKQGGPQASYTAPSKYDAQGNNIPTAGSKLIDAIPIYGPWARNAENESQTQGILPTAAGVATDVLGSKALAKGFSMAARATGAGMQYAAATPEARTVAQTRALVPGQPADLLSRALKPPVTSPDFEAQVDRSLPKIIEQNPQPGVKGFGSAAQAATGKEQQWYQGILDPHRNMPVDFSPTVRAQMASIPEVADLERPGLADKTAEVANRYLPKPAQTVTTTSPIADQFGRPITQTTTIPGEPPRTLGFADNLRLGLNQKSASLYAKAGGDRYAAMADPETSRTVAAGNSMRDITYKNLADASGVPEPEIRAQQSLYGDLKDVSDIANRRDVVFGRQNPYSLQESIAMSGGDPIRSPLAYLGQRMLKKVTDSDALTNAAVDRAKSPSWPSLPPRTGMIPQASTPVARLFSGAGRAVGKTPLRSNPLLYSAAANPPKRK